MGFSKAKGLSHVVTAADVTAGTVTLQNNVINPAGAIVTVVTSAGIPVAWDGGYTFGDGSITINNLGATDWAATNIINVVAY